MMKIKTNQPKFMKRFSVIATLAMLTISYTQADPFRTVDGEEVNHVKHCLFHGQIYESHFSPYAQCTFNVNNPHPGEPHYDAAGRNIAHDPECFGEHNLTL